MKKQIKKLSLNKKTISNLTAAEMSKYVGGVSMGCTETCLCPGPSGGKTRFGNTCPGHKTCKYC